VPDDVRADLGQQLRPYRRAFPDVRWTRPRTWHLTLLFLGSVGPQRVPEVTRLVEDISALIAPYEAVVDQGGGRSRRGEGVGWLGLSSGAGSLIEAATVAAQHCPAEITDGPPPKRTPSAHLTVARRADEAVIEALRKQACGAVGVGWRVDRIQLVRSHLAPDGARYETLHEATL
jgi:2'-5' RNA ligase